MVALHLTGTVISSANVGVDNSGGFNGIERLGEQCMTLWERP